MKKLTTTVALCIIGIGLSLKAATINVSGCSTTNYSNIGVSNQFIGQFTTDITGDSLSFGAMTFHVRTTNLIASISIVETNGDLFAPQDYTGGTDQVDGGGSSSFTFLLPPSYPLGTHTYQLRGTLSQSFTNGEAFSVFINPASDWQSGQTDSTGSSVTATPASQVSMGTVVALMPQPPVEILSPAEGDIVNVDTNNTIRVVIYCAVTTNLYIDLNGYNIAFNQGFPAGLSTNVFGLPNPYDYDGQQFTITASAEGEPIYFGGGVAFPLIVVAESGQFTINAPWVPRVPNVTTLSVDNVMRPGQIAHISCQWTNVSVGAPCTVVLDWSGIFMPNPSAPYSMQTPEKGPLTIRIPAGTFPIKSGNTNLTITLPYNIDLGTYGVTVLDTEYNLGYTVGSYTHIGLPYVPTNAVIDKLYLSQPSWTAGRVALLLEGLPNARYDVEESTNLVDWAKVTDSPLSDPSGSLYFSRDFTNVVNRFYRMVQAP